MPIRSVQLALLLVAALIHSPWCVAESPMAPISADALAQILALSEEKRHRNGAQRKLDSALWYAIKRHRGDPLMARFQTLGRHVTRGASGEALVDLRGRIDAGVMTRLDQLGGRVELAVAESEWARVAITLDAVEALAELPQLRHLRFAEPAYTRAQALPVSMAGPTHAARASAAPRRLGSVVSEGDAGHRVDVARAQYNVDGSGVLICAISDSVDELSLLQATGELPGNVLVLPGQAGVGTSEGTALLEIIHDLAPGAALGFARAGPSPAVMAQNIFGLRQAGCEVIIDDAYFLTEPVFQPGLIGQAIDAVVADGAIYITAAGNFFNLDSGLSGVWEGLFSPTTLPPLLAGAGLAAHDFGGTAMTTVSNDGASARFPISLQWANPAGQAGDDLDLYLLGPGLTAVVDASTSVQDGDDDALEILLGAADRTNAHLVVVKFSGDDVYFHLNTNGSLLSIGTDRQSIGHGGSLEQISVAAVGVHTLAPGAPFTGGPANPPEAFSSDGFRRVFFDAQGNPLGGRGEGGVGGIELMTPEITAADRVSTTTSQWLTFFGTSASAPHVAAVAGLYRQRFPGATAAQFRQALIDGGLDTGTPGFDRTAGGGIMMAPETLAGSFEFADSFEDPAAATR